MDATEEILNRIPHAEPFRFVDEFLAVSENEVKGAYTFKKESAFYKGHFPDQPITPGVLLIETMVQIGLLGIGICHVLNNDDRGELSNVVLSSADVSFLKPVYPDEKVIVTAEKIYLRFGKLKCKARMFKGDDILVCKGEISGMLLMQGETGLSRSRH